MNHAAFEKSTKNMRKHRTIILVTTERKINCLVSEPNYQTTMFFAEKFIN